MYSWHVKNPRRKSYLQKLVPPILPPPSKEFQEKMSQLFDQVFPTPVTGTPSPCIAMGIVHRLNPSSDPKGWFLMLGLLAMAFQNACNCPPGPGKTHQKLASSQPIGVQRVHEVKETVA